MANEPATAFVAFSLGPVQSFIAAARSVRDLWTGSYLLAWLTRHAMEPLLVDPSCGPDVFISPAVHDNPAIDLSDLRSPCLPNWFLAELPASTACDQAAKCEQACRTEWRRLCGAVRSRIHERVHNGGARWAASWSNLWDDQVRSFFDMRTVVLSNAACTEAELERLLGDKRCPMEGSNEHDRLWTDRAELAAAMLAATKSVRHIPNYRPKADVAGQFAPKCSLMGSYEQTGPARLDDSREFWEWFADHVPIRGSRTRKSERLCAVSLVKRFAWAADIAEQVGENPEKMRLEDTATVAATLWLPGDRARSIPELNPDHVRRPTQKGRLERAVAALVQTTPGRRRGRVPC
jgi:CRISPR-associated protein Cmr2